MPLRKGKKNIGKNIKTEVKAGRPRKQAIAIAMNVTGMKKNMKKKMKFPMKNKPIRGVKGLY
jgi:hypothetical protein